MPSRRGAIAGAILDVWYRYPTGDRAHAVRLRLPSTSSGNVLMTPHVSGWTEGCWRRASEVIAENIRRVAREEPPLNLIRRGGAGA